MSFHKQAAAYRDLSPECGSKSGDLKLARAVQHPPTRPSRGGWIPVREQPPAESGDYLVLLRGAKPRLMAYVAAHNSFVPRNLHPAVTHWMSLPLPPE
jgi:hypothetical protein